MGTCRKARKERAEFSPVPCTSGVQAGWLQTRSRVSYRYRAQKEMSEDVMENIYSMRSMHPWLLFGGDFEHRRADVSRTLL